MTMTTTHHEGGGDAVTVPAAYSAVSDLVRRVRHVHAVAADGGIDLVWSAHHDPDTGSPVYACEAYRRADDRYLGVTAMPADGHADETVSEAVTAWVERVERAVSRLLAAASS